MLHQISQLIFLSPEKVSGCVCIFLILNTFAFVLSCFTFNEIASFIKDAKNCVELFFDVISSFLKFWLHLAFFPPTTPSLSTRSIMRDCGSLSHKIMCLPSKLDENDTDMVHVFQSKLDFWLFIVLRMARKFIQIQKWQHFCTNFFLFYITIEAIQLFKQSFL